MFFVHIHFITFDISLGQTSLSPFYIYTCICTAEYHYRIHFVLYKVLLTCGLTKNNTPLIRICDVLAIMSQIVILIEDLFQRRM